MIVSANIPEKLVKLVDTIAFKEKITRSEWIKSLIKTQVISYIRNSKDMGKQNDN